MRSDIFVDRKGVHITLKKSVHAEFRKKLIERNISMQKVFNEFADLVGQGDFTAMKILECIVKRELNQKLEELKPIKRNEEPVDILDQETIYDMIERSDK